MGRKYTVSYQGTYTAAGTDTDLLEIQPADDKPVKLKGMIISQTSEVGDAQEEGVRLSCIQFPATFTPGSGGSTVTPAKVDSADSAAGFSAACNNTTVATNTPSPDQQVTRLEMGWNERNSPFDFWWPDGWEPKVKQGEGMVIRAQTTLADDMTIACTFFLEEE